MLRVPNQIDLIWNLEYYIQNNDKKKLFLQTQISSGVSSDLKKDQN